jgi:hypothetical protein
VCITGRSRALCPRRSAREPQPSRHARPAVRREPPPRRPWRPCRARPRPAGRQTPGLGAQGGRIVTDPLDQDGP